MTKQEFVARHRRWVAGVIAIGKQQFRSIRDAHKRPIESTEPLGGRIIDLARESDLLIERLFDDFIQNVKATDLPLGKPK